MSFFLLPLTLAIALFIHRRLSAPCGHHARRHRGCCPPYSARSRHQGGRGHRGAGHRCPSPCLGRPPPPRGGGVQGHRLGEDGYNCLSARVIFVFLAIFLGCGLAARPHHHHLFDLRRHIHRWTSPSGGRSAQCSPAREHRP
jgi:hypothetical protein